MHAQTAFTTLALVLFALQPALGHAGPGEGDWDAVWHDAGVDLGPAGPNPVASETGVCWATDSSFPADQRVEEINGHRVGVTVHRERSCHGEPVGSADEGASTLVYFSSKHLPGNHDGKDVKLDVKADGVTRSIVVPSPEDLRKSDITDAFSTVIVVDSGTPTTLQPNEDGHYVLRAWVMDYRDGEEPLDLVRGRVVDLSQRAGMPVVLRLWDQEAMVDQSTPVPPYNCSSGPGLFQKCGTIGGPGFELLLAENGLRIALDEAELAAFRGRTVVFSLFVDVSDETYPLFNDAGLGAEGLHYEPGNGFYNVAKTALALSPVASALDWSVTPVTVLPAQAGVRACGEEDPDGSYEAEGRDPMYREDVYVEVNSNLVVHIETLDAAPVVAGAESFVLDVSDGARDGGGFIHAGVYLGDRELAGAGTDDLSAVGLPFGPDRTCPGPASMEA